MAKSFLPQIIADGPVYFNRNLGIPAASMPAVPHTAE